MLGLSIVSHRSRVAHGSLPLTDKLLAIYRARGAGAGIIVFSSEPLQDPMDNSKPVATPTVL